MLTFIAGEVTTYGPPSPGRRISEDVMRNVLRRAGARAGMRVKATLRIDGPCVAGKFQADRTVGRGS